MFFNHVVNRFGDYVYDRPPALHQTLLETGRGVDCKCSRHQRLNVPSEARNFGKTLRTIEMRKKKQT
jgi:hypothetical protein